MKKYILFIGLCSLALIQLGASEKIKGDQPQDSINGKGRFNIEIPNIEIPDIDLDFDALNFHNFGRCMLLKRFINQYFTTSSN